jgi:hypothetical protein
VRAAVVCLLLVAVDYLAYPRLAHIGGCSLNTGENGLWLRYTWYFGKWQDTDLQKLARRLQSGQIRYGYFHVREVAPNGHLRYHYLTSARRLTAALHREAPGTKAIAWVYAGNERTYSSDRADLSNPAVRQTMTKEAAWLVNDCGFDGVQWDYEVCGDGDQRLLALLDETRAVLPKGKIISVCTPMWYPWPWPRGYRWSEEYFAAVAARCDQLTVMCYDSMMYLPRAYVWLVRQQAPHVTRAIAGRNPECRVLLGVPNYGRGGPFHNPHAENIRLALKGVREGLSDRQTLSSSFAGISIFADWTTTPDEWQQWSQLWLERGVEPRRGQLSAPR